MDLAVTGRAIGIVAAPFIPAGYGIVALFVTTGLYDLPDRLG